MYLPRDIHRQHLPRRLMEKLHPPLVLPLDPAPIVRINRASLAEINYLRVAFTLLPFEFLEGENRRVRWRREAKFKGAVPLCEVRADVDAGGCEGGRGVEGVVVERALGVALDLVYTPVDRAGFVVSAVDLYRDGCVFAFVAASKPDCMLGISVSLCKAYMVLSNKNSRAGSGLTRYDK